MWMQAHRILIIVALLAIRPVSAGTATIDDMCTGITNAHECSATIEEAQLPLWEDRVARAGTKLVLTLDSGEVIELEDDRYFYRFRECSKTAAKCVFVKGANEVVRYIAVDVITGRRDYYRGMVTYSPSGATFVVGGLWSSCGGTTFLEIRDTATDVMEFALDYKALFELGGKSQLCLEAEDHMRLPQAGQARWLDESTISFNLWCNEGVPSLASISLTLVRNETGWRLSATP